MPPPPRSSSSPPSTHLATHPPCRRVRTSSPNSCLSPTCSKRWRSASECPTTWLSRPPVAGWCTTCGGCTGTHWRWSPWTTSHRPSGRWCRPPSWTEPCRRRWSRRRSWIGVGRWRRWCPYVQMVRSCWIVKCPMIQICIIWAALSHLKYFIEILGRFGCFVTYMCGLVPCICGTKRICSVGEGTIQQMGHGAEVKRLISGTVARNCSDLLQAEEVFCFCFIFCARRGAYLWVRAIWYVNSEMSLLTSRVTVNDNNGGTRVPLSETLTL